MIINKYSKIDNSIYRQLQIELRKSRKKKRIYFPVAIFHEESISIEKLPRKKTIRERLSHIFSYMIK